MDGLQSGRNFFNMYHLDCVKEVINNKVENSTMFSSNCGYIAYWKFEDGFLHHTSMFRKTDWVKTKFTNINQANSAGVVDIYNLKELEDIYND